MSDIFTMLWVTARQQLTHAPSITQIKLVRARERTQYTRRCITVPRVVHETLIVTSCDYTETWKPTWDIWLRTNCQETIGMVKYVVPPYMPWKWTARQCKLRNRLKLTFSSYSNSRWVDSLAWKVGFLVILFHGRVFENSLEKNNEM